MILADFHWLGNRPEDHEELRMLRRRERAEGGRWVMKG
jgi:hypothetical protein